MDVEIVTNTMNCRFNDVECDYAMLTPCSELDNCPEYKEIKKIEAEGHTFHCACRIHLGDGECVCKRGRE